MVAPFPYIARAERLFFYIQNEEVTEWQIILD